MPAPPTVAAHKMHFHRDFPWKEPVRVATTASGTFSTAFANGQVVDGVTIATGDRILLKDQATGSQNGLYTVNASGAPTRAYDMDVATEVLGALVYVVTGGQTGTFWYCTNTAAVTLGSTTITFAQAIPATGPAFATPAIVLGTAAAAGAAATVIRSDSTIVAFDATVPVTQAFGDAAATGSVAKAARRDHKHGMPAAPVLTLHEVVMESGTSSPPVPIWNSAGDDWIYSS